MDAKEKKIVFLTSTVHALVHMQMLIFAAINIEMANDLGASITAIGFVGTIGFFLFGFGALPAGFIIDKIGARKVLAISLCGIAVADAILAFAPGGMWAMIGLALLGLSGSMYHPAGLGLISRNVRQTGHALGIHGTIGNFGVASGPLVAGFVASMFGWRWAYLWPLIPTAALAVTYIFIRFGDVGEDHKHLNPEPNKKFSAGMLRVMLLVIVLQAISGFMYRASNTFMPAFTGQALSEFFSNLDATARGGLFTGIILIAGSVGQYLSGWLTKKHSTEKLQLLATILVAPLLLAMSLLSGLPMLGSAMAFAFVFYGLQPLGNSLVAKYSPPGLRGRSYGLSFFLSFGLGAFGSGFAGYVGEYQGFSQIYMWLAAIGVISILIAIIVFQFAVKREQKNSEAAVTGS